MRFLILLAIGILVVGCGSEGDIENNSDFNSGAEQNTSQKGQNNEENSLLEFQDKLEKDPEYMVEYEITHSDESKQVVKIYTKDKKSRVEMDQYTAWIVDNKSFVEVEGMCIEAGESGFNPESIYETTTIEEGSLRSADEYAEVSAIGTRRIAGETTECYEFLHETDVSQLTTYCLTSEGIPALIRTVEDGDLVTETRALSLSSDVDDSDLEPCEPNFEMPN